LLTEIESDTNMNAIIDTALVNADHAEATGVLSHLSVEQLETLNRARVRLMNDDASALHALSIILDKQVRMPAYRWDAAVKSFDALARKAAERKLPVPIIEEISRETIGDGETAETWVTARILGAAPVLNGWRCVATLTRMTSVDLIRRARGRGCDVNCGQFMTLVCKVVDETNCAGVSTWTLRHASGLISDVSTEELVTHNWWLVEQTLMHEALSTDPDIEVVAPDRMRCDHCEQNRRRNLTFMLVHEDGREMQVGSTCLNEYLGTDALGAWFVWSRLHEIVDTLAGWGEYYDLHEHAEWLASHATAATRKAASAGVEIDALAFLAACVAEIRVNGYMSRTRAREQTDRRDRFDRLAHLPNR
jgi:hypothetical protein